MASLSVNKHGKLYEKGANSSEIQRAEVMMHYHKGLSFGEIAKKSGMSKSGCQKNVKRANELQSLRSRQRPGIDGRSTTDEVITFIEFCKYKTPSIEVKDIRKQMLDRGVCTEENLPNETTVRGIIRNELGMTRKMIQQVPAEATGMILCSTIF